MAAHFVVKEVHDFDIPAPEVRFRAEIVENVQVAEDSAEDESFSEEEIFRSTRLARDYGFDYFESGRAANTAYGDTQFFELQTFMGMVGCETAQGATRFQYRRGGDYGPHGATHLRAVKQLSPEELVNSFNNAMERYFRTSHPKHPSDGPLLPPSPSRPFPTMGKSRRCR